MIPGLTSKASETTVAVAATITAKSDIVIVTGTGTTVNTIVPSFGGGFSGFLVLIPTNAAGITLGTAGNILVGIAAAQNRAVFLMYVKSLGKWVINSGV